MSQTHFQKFVPKKKNSLVKEEFKQAKKKAKKERSVAIEKRFEEKRRLKAAERNGTPAQKDATGKFPAKADRPSAAKTIEKKKEDKIASIESNFIQTEKILGIKKEYAPADKKPAVKKAGGKPEPISNVQMPLNKFLAHCGVCSRRDAVTIIKEGKVKVNDAVIIEPAFKVTERDDVKFNGKKLFVSKNLVYILLNKPKDYITTTDDPQGRKTVLQLTKMATTERIYPVGRLDRNTSGVLLLTNDGELTQKLSHPSYNITKVYEV